MLDTYAKRRKDMTISADRSQSLPVSRLGSALRESCGNLSLEGIGGNLYLPETEEELPVAAAFAAYDLFEDALEAALDTLRYFYVTVSEGEDGLALQVNFECGADLTPLGARYPAARIERDEDGWFLSLTLRGGERPPDPAGDAPPDGGG